VMSAVVPVTCRMDAAQMTALTPLLVVRLGIMSTRPSTAPSVGIVVAGPAVYAVRMIAQEKGISLVRPVGMGHSNLMKGVKDEQTSIMWLS
jgi:hypothetical protein